MKNTKKELDELKTRIIELPLWRLILFGIFFGWFILWLYIKYWLKGAQD